MQVLIHHDSTGLRVRLSRLSLSVFLVLFIFMLSFGLNACTSKPPPTLKPPAPPAKNPLPSIPKAEEIQTIDPNHDPSALPKPEQAS